MRIPSVKPGKETSSTGKARWSLPLNAALRLEKLAALVPIPRVHLIRFHGCLAPHSKIRSKVVPKHDPEETPSEGRSSHAGRMSWAQLLKRVFQIDIGNCSRCGGKTKIIAAVLQNKAIEAILSHLQLPTTPPSISPARAPPQEKWDF